MTGCPFNSASENIADFIYRYGSRQQFFGNSKDIPCMDFVSTDLRIIYTPIDTVNPISLSKFSYYSIPGLYTLLGSGSMEASGILATHTSPALSNQDGTTRIISIWDQSLPDDKDNLPDGVPNRYNASGATYGTEYIREQINEALESDNPLTLVPSTDTNGHGTFLAGIAAGGVLPGQNFTGAAPECELIIN
ncbi:Uncharacterised protein [[Clostridium] symbiosum]|uniref:Peptidase S8/S53 domain-containing protein n=1 Tax=Clostridium symbiosum TaxID=1512 RepID=A0A6N2ZZ18_CLOSY